MAMFGMKKAKGSENAELVLAYLEEAQRLRTTLTIQDDREREVGAAIVSVLEDRIVLAPQGPLLVDKGTTLRLMFLMDGLRFKAPARLLEAKPGAATFELPGSIALAERRRKPRARLNPREGATVTALTGLFDGIGLSGAIENISEGGLCLRVERAMDVKTQRKMPMGANLLQIGQPFMLVKLSKLPKCPTIEVAGTVAYLDTSQGLTVGITFESGKEPLLAPVKNLVASRTTAIPTSVPPKARRQPEAPREEDGEGRLPRTPTPRKEPDPAPQAEAAPAPSDARPAPAPAAPPAPEPAPVDERALALLRMKKRTRGVLLAMAAGPERDALRQFLTEDGYGRVTCSDTLSDLLEQVERPGLHLILVDGGVAEVHGLGLASLLRHKLDEDMPPLILAEASVDAELVVGAQQTGVAQILVKPYDLDSEFLRMIEGHLGIG